MFYLKTSLRADAGHVEEIISADWLGNARCSPDELEKREGWASLHKLLPASSSLSRVPKVVFFFLYGSLLFTQSVLSRAWLCVFLLTPSWLHFVLGVEL